VSEAAVFLAGADFALLTAIFDAADVPAPAFAALAAALFAAVALVALALLIAPA
jgi:hypothetical protein